MGFTIGHGSYKPPVDTLQVRTILVVRRGVHTTYQVIFLVGHHPWPGCLPMIPGICISVVGRFHCAIAIITAVGLCIAIIKTASRIIVVTIDNPVLAFCLVINGCTFYIVL